MRKTFQAKTTFILLKQNYFVLMITLIKLDVDRLFSSSVCDNLSISKYCSIFGGSNPQVKLGAVSHVLSPYLTLFTWLNSNLMSHRWWLSRPARRHSSRSGPVFPSWKHLAVGKGDLVTHGPVLSLILFSLALKKLLFLWNMYHRVIILFKKSIMIQLPTFYLENI